MDVTRKQRKENFSKNELFLSPDTHRYVCVSGGKKCSFFRKFVMLYFLVMPLLSFAFLPHYRRNHTFFDFSASVLKSNS